MPVEVEGIRLIADMVAAGGGVSVLPETRDPARACTASGASSLAGVPPRRLGLVTARDAQLSLADRAVREGVLRLVERQRELDGGLAFERCAATRERSAWPTRSASREQRSGRRRGSIVAGIAVVLVLWFAIVNWQRVTIDYIIFERESRLFFVIIGSALLGCARRCLLRGASPRASDATTR